MDSLPVGLDPQTLKYFYLSRKSLVLFLSRCYHMALGCWKDNLGEKIEGGKNHCLHGSYLLFGDLMGS